MWARDECRLGLKPVARRVWAPIGSRPLCGGKSRFEWVWVYGFVRPQTGECVCLMLPKVNAESMSSALAEFVARADPCGERVIVLIVDRAGWHVAGDLVVPDGVELFYLPSCTPELQPCEAYRPLLREAMANETFATLKDLEVALARRIDWLVEHPETVKGEVGFHWALGL